MCMAELFVIVAPSGVYFAGSTMTRTEKMEMSAGHCLAGKLKSCVVRVEKPVTVKVRHVEERSAEECTKSGDLMEGGITGPRNVVGEECQKIR